MLSAQDSPGGCYGYAIDDILMPSVLQLLMAELYQRDRVAMKITKWKLSKIKNDIYSEFMLLSILVLAKIEWLEEVIFNVHVALVHVFNYWLFV